VLVPRAEALELLRFRDVVFPRKKLEWEDELAQTDAMLSDCLASYEHMTEVARVRAQALEKAESGHSTLTVVLWTVLGVVAGAAAGYAITRF
jgi:hypothetical protein